LPPKLSCNGDFSPELVDLSKSRWNSTFTAGFASCTDIAELEDVQALSLSGRVFSPIPAEKQLRNATKAQRANDRSDADPFPSGRSNRQ
jgi:hypothetical protein